MKSILIIIFAVLINTVNLFAQADSNNTVQKTVILAEKSKSPTKAVYLSLAVPGLGQYYVESYWKAPLFFGGAVACYYGIFSNHSKYIDKEKEWKDAKNALIIDPGKIEYLRRWKEQYRDWRDQSGMYLIGVYILASVDAYVGAHLYDFNVNDKVSLNMNFNHYNPQICLSINF